MGRQLNQESPCCPRIGTWVQIPNTHVKAGHGGSCLQSYRWGDRERNIPRVHWPARLSRLVCSKLLREIDLQKVR